MSKEVGVTPRDSNSGPFSEPGDSGSSVVDGKGRIAGLPTDGAGATDSVDYSCITYINFLCKRMAIHGLKVNFFPSFPLYMPSVLHILFIPLLKLFYLSLSLSPSLSEYYCSCLNCYSLVFPMAMQWSLPFPLLPSFPHLNGGTSGGTYE